MEATLSRNRMAVGMMTAVLTFAGAAVSAQSKVTRIPLPNSTFPISEGVWVGDTLYLSGMLDSSVAKGTPGDTETQTVHSLENIKHALEEQHLSMGDVVLMHVYLGGDPATGKMDFAGMNAEYAKYFGTADQPNKPARSAVQVANLVSPTALLEIEVIAVKGK